MSLSCPANSTRRARIIDEQEEASSETPSFSHNLTLAPDLRELGDELGQRRVEISDEAVIGDLEDRRLLVLVDRDNDLRILHPRQMLDRSGDADRDIELGRHDLAGLADLPIVWRVARIDRGARGAHRRAELV